MNPLFWKNKSVFLTGHTGFKGSWMALWLHLLGAKVKGYALPPNTHPALFQMLHLDQIIDSQFGDINNYTQLSQSMKESEPDIVLHFAAQPLVRESYLHPLETYQTNVMGTAHVLEAIRHTPSVKAAVMITTDKCYENKEWVWPYRENEAMGGYDPYSSSKGCAELVTAAYRRSFFEGQRSMGLATARAGNVIGGGDFSKDRLIPDFIRALEKNESLSLRYPQAIRPWQHVLEPLNGYLYLAEALFQDPQTYSEAWNFGPRSEDTLTVSEIIDRLSKQWGLGSWQADAQPQPHEAHYLKLDIQKAETLLKWKPCLNIDEALLATAQWYQAWMSQIGMLDFTRNQIQRYQDRSLS